MARTRAPDYDDKRQAILHRTAELFARHGFTGASITMIAEACGISKALLYHYYRDKDAVLFDILADHLSLLVTAVEAAAAAPASARERLHAIVAALLDAYRDADAEHQVQITSLKLLPPEQQDQLKEMERTLVRIFAEALAAAVPQVGRRPQPADAADHVAVRHAELALSLVPRGQGAEPRRLCPAGDRADPVRRRECGGGGAAGRRQGPPADGNRLTARRG